MEYKEHFFLCVDSIIKQRPPPKKKRKLKAGLLPKAFHLLLRNIRPNWARNMGHVLNNSYVCMHSCSCRQRPPWEMCPLFGSIIDEEGAEEY